jgi:hypothetical protein
MKQIYKYIVILGGNNFYQIDLKIINMIKLSVGNSFESFGRHVKSIPIIGSQSSSMSDLSSLSIL